MLNDNINQKIIKIAENWFLTEPAIFAIYYTHELTENERMLCPIRSGQGRIEYNPYHLAKFSTAQIEELIRAEVIRILLKHPYERQPRNCSANIVATASDCVLSSYYNFKLIQIFKPSQFSFPERESFEWYAENLQERQSNINDNQQNTNQETSTKDSSSTDETASDKIGLWEDDEMRRIQINNTINTLAQWGSLPNHLVEQIIASTKATIDYRKIFSWFRASILSNQRNLTRMRPNRRTDFANMGSVYRFKTNLLVAVDVSASIKKQTLADFYTIINHFFHYGVEHIDVIQFDCELGEIESIQKASQHINIQGRGGTNFQIIVDFVAEHNYDGVIIFTDGYAPEPEIPKTCRTKFLWICNNTDNYKAHHIWMETIGHCCVINA